MTPEEKALEAKKILATAVRCGVGQSMLSGNPAPEVSRGGSENNWHEFVPVGCGLHARRAVESALEALRGRYNTRVEVKRPSVYSNEGDVDIFVDDQDVTEVVLLNHPGDDVVIAVEQRLEVIRGCCYACGQNKA